MAKLYRTSPDFDCYYPSDGVGMVAFSRLSNDLYHLPVADTSLFTEHNQQGFVFEQFSQCFASEEQEVAQQAFKDMINKGILVAVN